MDTVEDMLNSYFGRTFNLPSIVSLKSQSKDGKHAFSGGGEIKNTGWYLAKWYPTSLQSSPTGLAGASNNRGPNWLVKVDNGRVWAMSYPNIPNGLWPSELKSWTCNEYWNLPDVWPEAWISDRRFINWIGSNNPFAPKS